MTSGSYLDLIGVEINEEMLIIDFNRIYSETNDLQQTIKKYLTVEILSCLEQIE